MKNLIIGVAGPSASGKTTITNNIANKVGESNVSILRQDNYYEDQSGIDMKIRVKTNYDHPSAFDMDLLVEDLKNLKKGKEIKMPTYDYVNHTRSERTVVVKPKKIIILEGIFAFQTEELRNLMDVKIFVQTDLDVCFIRRLERDIKERKRSPEAIIEQYLKFVKPMYDQFIEPTKKYADLIIPNDQKNEIAVNMFSNNLEFLLNN